MPHQMNEPDEYEVLEVSEGRKPAGVVSVRLGPEEMSLLTSLAASEGGTLSETLRRGLRCLAESAQEADRPALAVCPTGTTASAVWTRSGELSGVNYSHDWLSFTASKR